MVKGQCITATRRRKAGGKSESGERRYLERSPLHGKTSGLTTKVHAAVDSRGRLFKLILKPGQTGDDTLFHFQEGEKLLEGLCANHGSADEANCSDGIRPRVKRMWA